MSGEISLSLEETNKLRIQLGLKPIVEETKRREETKETQTGNVREDNEVHFIAKDKVSMLRNKLDKMNQKISLHQASIISESSNNKEDGDNWLNSVRERKPNPNKVKLNHYNEEEEEEGEDEDDDLPIMQVSHDIRKLSKGKSTILTLKETSIGNEGEDEDTDDILEDEDVAIQEQTAKNLKLKSMNKDRRRKKMVLDVSSKDIAQTEENAKVKPIQNTIVVGGEIQTSENIEKSAAESQSNLHFDGKIRVAFDNHSDDDDEEEEDATDFKPVKIKKRKRKDKDQSSNRKRNIIKLPSEIQSVKLGDDEEEESGDEDFIIPQRKKVSNCMSSEEIDEEDISMIIRREKIEKEARLKSLNKMQSIQNSGLTIDETTTFFDSLNSNILNEPQSFEKISSKDISVPSPASDNPVEDKPQDSVSDIIPKPKVDFYNGLASTLNFLKDHNILPKKEDIPPSDTPHVKDQVGEEGDHSGVNLETYNPTINLEYKDAQGNKLTTKEAYKKLSQKFHGTKSNKKKQLKFNQRVKDRNSLSGV